MRLSKNMQFLKKESDFTFKELEEKTKISVSVLHRYTNGSVKGLEINLKNIETIAKAFRVTPIALVGWDKYVADSEFLHSADNDFSTLQRALYEIDKLSNTNKELFFAGGFDFKKMTMGEVIERAEAIKAVLGKINDEKK